MKVKNNQLSDKTLISEERQQSSQPNSELASPFWKMTNSISFVEEINALVKLSIPKSSMLFSIKDALRQSFNDDAMQDITAKDSKQSQLQYWQQQLNDVTPLELPLDYPRSPQVMMKEDQHSFKIPDSVTNHLQELSKQLDTDLATILLASFLIFLSCYTGGQDDICIGNSSGNGYESMEMMAAIANCLPVRVTIDLEKTLKDFVFSLKDIAKEVYQNADVTCREIINATKLASDPTRNPLFDVLFSMQSNACQPFEFSQPLEQASGIAHFDLALGICEINGYHNGFFAFNNRVFKKDTIRRMANNYLTLLEHLHPNALISDLEIISPEEQVLIQSFHAPIRDDQNLCIHQAFEEIAEQYPERVALAFEGRFITYQELNTLSNSKAHSLIKHKIARGSIVAICMERSDKAEIAAIAVLKAGCSLLFLETDQREVKTIHKKIKTIMPSAIIVDSQTEQLLRDEASTNLFNEIKILNYQQLHSEDFSNPKIIMTVKDSAFVVTTSGTTGDSKGVELSHQGWCNWINYFRTHGYLFELDKDSKIFLGAPYIFDASLWERLLAYGLGGTLYVNSIYKYRDPEELKELFHKEAITIATFTPSFLVALNPNDFQTLKCIFVVGESLSKELITSWKQAIPGLKKVVNGYGPTEVTAGVTLYPWVIGSPVFIGKPIDNMRVYILDANMKPVPVGVVGEIFIAGVGLAKGYYNQPAKTAEVFIQKGSVRLYRTGDQGRFMPDGNIEFKGRVKGDTQIKLRGVRLETEEIASVLATHPKVKRAVIKVWDNEYLAAYLLPKEGELFDEDLLHHGFKAFLSNEGLTGVKVPSAYVAISTVPLTKNDKLDRAALPRPVFHGKLELPKTPTEKYVLKIWQELFTFKVISTLDNFREIGGDSTLLARLVNKLNLEFLQEQSCNKLRFFDLPFEFNIQQLSSLIAERIVMNAESIITTSSREKLNDELYTPYSNSP
jgi:amino acid adenylation domain-containing protein